MRWIPRILSDDVKIKRIAASKLFLRWYQRKGEDFLDRIVTTDKMIINLYDPETKRESSVWKRTSSPPPLKARVTKSAQRVMFIFFMDRRGMLLVPAVPEGQTVNAKYYSKVIIRKFISGLIKNFNKTQYTYCYSYICNNMFVACYHCCLQLCFRF